MGAIPTGATFLILAVRPSTTRTMSTRPSRKRAQLDYKNPVRYMTDGEVKVAAMEEEEEAAGKARRKKPRTTYKPRAKKAETRTGIGSWFVVAGVHRHETGSLI